MGFLEYELTAPTLCIGERVKGGIFRPCDTRTIRYSTITGALRAYFPYPDLHATGYLEEEEGYNQVDYFVYSPQDRVAGISKVPITAQFLTNVHGRIYVKEGNFELPKEIHLAMGALKSRGFGQCRLQHLRTLDAQIVRGELRTRIPCDLQAEFDIRNVIKHVYGYLFRPTSPTDGIYVLSLFEGSVVAGPYFLVKEAPRG